MHHCGEQTPQSTAGFPSHKRGLIVFCVGVIEPSAYLGTLIADKYFVEELIGSGGFAWVYRGSAPDEPTVAIKVLHNTDTMALARFHREIKVLKSLPKNPHVVEYVDDGHTGERQPFLVLGHLEGRTLMQEMSEWQQLEPRRAVEFLSELCDAFVELHQLGVAHRDVKPENIILTSQGTIRLIDFGLIRDAQGILKLLEQDERLERRIFQDEIDRWLIAGTPEYMAPEQFTDALAVELAAVRTDTWSDVFSLGVILFELIVGNVPFPVKAKTDRHEVRRAILKYMQWRMELTDDDMPVCRGIDRALDSILRKALRIDPRQRQPNAQALKDDLDRYIETGQGVRRDYDTGTLAMTFEELRELEATRRKTHHRFKALERAFEDDEGSWNDESTFEHLSDILEGLSVLDDDDDDDDEDEDEDEDTVADPNRWLARDTEEDRFHTTKRDLRVPQSGESTDIDVSDQSDSFVIIDLPPPGEAQVESDEASTPEATTDSEATTQAEELSLRDTIPEQIDPPGGSVFNQTWVLDVSDTDEDLRQAIKKRSKGAKGKGVGKGKKRPKRKKS